MGQNEEKVGGKKKCPYARITQHAIDRAELVGIVELDFTALVVEERRFYEFHCCYSETAFIQSEQYRLWDLQVPTRQSLLA